MRTKATDLDRARWILRALFHGLLSTTGLKTGLSRDWDVLIADGRLVIGDPDGTAYEVTVRRCPDEEQPFGTHMIV
jgi:hypothetical protein